MTGGIVVDASTALAWCFPDEASAYADRVLEALDGKELLVPPIWGLELANAALVGEKRKRLAAADIEDFMSLLGNLWITEEPRPVVNRMREVVPIARMYGLTAYDAAYLELAIRRDVPLATLDGKLRGAAREAGVALFEE